MLEPIEASLIALIESTQDSIWSVDPDFRLLTFNHAVQLDWETAFGATVTVGKLPDELFPPEVAEAWFPLYRRALAHGAFSLEWLFTTGRMMQLHLYPMRLNGATVGVSVFATDITLQKQLEARLQDSEERYRETFEQAAIGIMHVAFDGLIQRCNKRFAEILGYPVDEIIGQTFKHFTPEDFLESCDAVLHRLIQGAAVTVELEKPYIRRDNTLVWTRITASLQRDAKGVPLHVLCFIEDISGRRAAEERLDAATQELQTTNSRYATVFQTSMDALSISSLATGRYLEANPAGLEMMGFTRDELIGRTAAELNIWPYPHERDHIVELLRLHSSFRDEPIHLRKKNGDIFNAIVSCSLIDIEGDTCLVAVTRDISNRKAAENQIRNLAFYDPLTHLPNRRLLLDRLQQTLTGTSRSNHHRALLFVDLDDFKSLNKSLGHGKGDHLLQEVAKRLSAAVSEADTVARFAGDEFVIILEDLSEDPENAASEVEVIGKKILQAIGQPLHLGDEQTQGTASIGVTVFADASQTPSEALRQADFAMSQAKSDGGNTVRFFSPELQAVVNARTALKQELSHAAANGQLVLFYQPQVDATGIIGAEALIRWQHPTRGLVEPNDFIPLAEETGVIHSLGQWVIEHTCRQLAVWTAQKSHRPIPIAINISAREFGSPDFVTSLLDTLNRTGADPQYLKLELTESMLASDIDEVIARMKLLRSHGIRFALDDFGTGFSSLSYLKRLPLHQLKIDRAFVQDIMADVASAAIAQTIIALGRTMRLSVIAEGVETEAQRRFLASLGAHSFQGFLFGRPVPLQEFEKLWLH